MRSRLPTARGLRSLVVVVAAVTIAVGCSDDGDAAPELEDPAATGRELVTEFATILMEGDLEDLEDYLSDAFQIQRADGSGRDKAEYLEAPSQVDSFEIDDLVIAEQDGDVLTVRWSILADAVVEGEELDKVAAPRLSTFHWSDGRWRLTSHANFALPD